MFSSAGAKCSESLPTMPIIAFEWRLGSGRLSSRHDDLIKWDQFFGDNSMQLFKGISI
jgi:hypothetical protein